MAGGYVAGEWVRRVGAARDSPVTAQFQLGRCSFIAPLQRLRGPLARDALQTASFSPPKVTPLSDGIKQSRDGRSECPPDSELLATQSHAFEWRRKAVPRRPAQNALQTASFSPPKVTPFGGGLKQSRDGPLRMPSGILSQMKNTRREQGKMHRGALVSEHRGSCSRFQALHG